MTSKALFSSFGRRHYLINNRFNANRFSSSSSAAANSSKLEDDTFSELDADVSNSISKKIKLVTEKPERFRKTDPSGREMAGRPLSTVNKSKIMSSAVSRRVIASPNSCPKLGDPNDASTLSYYSSKISGADSKHSISVQNVCATAGLYELVKAISIFGKVVGASFVNVANGSKRCDIKFEGVESSQKAISAGKIELGSQIYPIFPIDTLNVMTFRIKNISENTSEHMIHLMCKSAGELVGLARTRKDCAEALFNVRNEANRLDLLKRLNSVVIDECSWAATMVENNSCGAGGNKLNSWIDYRIPEMRRQMLMQKINLDDLETLIASIIHIQEEYSI